jgi:nicotinamide riboside kinase
VIAIVGAESTGKTTLAQALAARLRSLTGQRCTWVPEVLRRVVRRQGRTPQRHEQAAIARAAGAHRRRRPPRRGGGDTTPLMTAVYSRLVFGDRLADALRPCSSTAWLRLTLLTALDLPWVADGLQRDGPQVREPVDAALAHVHRVSKRYCTPQKSQPTSTRRVRRSGCRLVAAQAAQHAAHPLARAAAGKARVQRLEARSALPRTGGAGWCRRPASAVRRASAWRPAGRCGCSPRCGRSRLRCGAGQHRRPGCPRP